MEKNGVGNVTTRFGGSAAMGPLPALELQEKQSCGPNPELTGLKAIGTDSEPVPVAAFAVSFSSEPRVAPTPFGKLIWGTVNEELSEEELRPF
jgi:hypothetical protein